MKTVQSPFPVITVVESGMVSDLYVNQYFDQAKGI